MALHLWECALVMLIKSPLNRVIMFVISMATIFFWDYKNWNDESIILKLFTGKKEKMHMLWKHPASHLAKLSSRQLFLFSMWWHRGKCWTAVVDMMKIRTTRQLFRSYSYSSRICDIPTGTQYSGIISTLSKCAWPKVRGGRKSIVSIWLPS